VFESVHLRGGRIAHIQDYRSKKLALADRRR
jgi:hypothetical protein